MTPAVLTGPSPLWPRRISEKLLSNRPSDWITGQQTRAGTAFHDIGGIKLRHIALIAGPLMPFASRTID